MRVLILGGTGEARALASLAVDAGFSVTTSLAGRTSGPLPTAGTVRSGGFGGPEGLCAFVAGRRFARLVDATHPFATTIGCHARTVGMALGLPRLRLLRPPWRQETGDRWYEVDGAAEAAALLPDLGERAFLTQGRDSLAPFADLAGRAVLIRSIEAPSSDGARFPGARWIRARGPFALEDEIALMTEHRIDVLVSKASGGEATRAKIDAARTCGIPVILLKRPPPPPGPLVSTPGEALSWLQGEPDLAAAAGRSTCQ